MALRRKYTWIILLVYRDFTGFRGMLSQQWRIKQKRTCGMKWTVFYVRVHTETHSWTVIATLPPLEKD